jgi:DNA invertase Pin-like site-specific DNA recombinase
MDEGLMSSLMTPPPVTPRQALAYIRVSTDEQALSVEAQRALITRWCQTHAVELVGVYEDVGLNGHTPIEKRPGLFKALSALSRGMALVVARRDRLARDVIVAALAERFARKAGASIIAVDGHGNGDSPESQLMATIIDAFAAYERAVIVMRTKAALDHKRQKGERIGNLPYGKTLAPDGVHLLPYPPEQAVIACARRLRQRGLSHKKIAKRLTARGFTSRAGTPFSHVQVGRMLAQPVGDPR